MRKEASKAVCLREGFEGFRDAFRQRNPARRANPSFFNPSKRVKTQYCYWSFLDGQAEDS